MNDNPAARFIKRVGEYVVYLPLGTVLWAIIGAVFQLMPALFLWFPLILLVGFVARLIGHPIVSDNTLIILAVVVVVFFGLFFVVEWLRGDDHDSPRN